MVRVFGIRHHGPGSARRLRQAFERWRPDCVLIEMPADTESVLRQAADPGLRPPVALVCYDEQDIQRASFYPFTSFSPEWQALQWALRTDATVRAIDLPARHQFALRATAATGLLDPTDDAETLALQRDPLAVIARLAGFTDSERWWDTTLEQMDDDEEVFAAVLEMVDTLRRAYRQADRPDTLRREAYMRQVVRQAVRDGFARIAVVCGAWHAPALAQWEQYAVATDRKRLQKMPRSKVGTAWVPWSYEHLLRESGYGAGISSPAWYAMCYQHDRQAVVHWMVAAGRLLREAGFDSSPAQVQEAVRLATSLAALRGQALPGLAELREAALATLAAGKDERLSLIEHRLIVGEQVGEVPAGLAVVPLQRDLEAQLRQSRLNKYWGQSGRRYLKATKAQPRGGIDLRQPTDLAKSILLHRLRLLGITWGQQEENSAADLGGFKEIWQLHWLPAFSLSLLEAAGWGNTIAEATATRARALAATGLSLAALAALIRQLLQADLPAIAAALSGQLRRQAALQHDAAELLGLLPELVRTVRYGDARRTDVTSLLELLLELLPRIVAGLPTAAAHLDDEASAAILQDIRQAHVALDLLDLEALTVPWIGLLETLAGQDSLHALARGGVTRLLADRHHWPVEETARRLAYALSGGQGSTAIAYWLEGFLGGSGLLLIHQPRLRELIDDWISGLPTVEFQEVVPLLRRAFARFSTAERRQLLALTGPDRPVAKLPDAPGPSLPTAEADLLAALRTWWQPRG